MSRPDSPIATAAVAAIRASTTRGFANAYAAAVNRFGTPDSAGVCGDQSLRMMLQRVLDEDLLEGMQVGLEDLEWFKRMIAQDLVRNLASSRGIEPEQTVLFTVLRGSGPVSVNRKRLYVTMTKDMADSIHLNRIARGVLSHIRDIRDDPFTLEVMGVPALQVERLDYLFLGGFKHNKEEIKKRSDAVLRDAAMGDSFLSE